MCNLYMLNQSAAEVAALLQIEPPSVGIFNASEEVYPGYPGMVVTQEGYTRHLQAMTWGFPRPMKSKRTGLPIKPKAVNNARDDKLLSPFWRSSFEKRRCLIPVTQWAEAEGEERKMTRTWYSLHGADLFAAAGIWRWSQEWGNVYSMVMVDGCAQMSDVHDRMPVILRPEHWDQWTIGSPDEALALAQTCDATLAVDRTTAPWVKPRVAEVAGSII
jgi:putative SOS response-associated peptidase YedK